MDGFQWTVVNVLVTYIGFMNGEIPFFILDFKVYVELPSVFPSWRRIGIPCDTVTKYCLNIFLHVTCDYTVLTTYVCTSVLQPLK